MILTLHHIHINSPPTIFHLLSVNAMKSTIILLFIATVQTVPHCFRKKKKTWKKFKLLTL